MDFTLSKEHEMARTLFHDFAEKEVKPLAQEVDETEVFPRETVGFSAENNYILGRNALVSRQEYVSLPCRMRTALGRKVLYFHREHLHKSSLFLTERGLLIPLGEVGKVAFF